MLLDITPFFYFFLRHPNHVGYHLLRVMYSAPDCCRGRLCLARPISPDTKSFLPVFPLSAACISLQPQSCNAARFLSISNKTPCLLCQVTLKSYAFYSLRLLICNIVKRSFLDGQTQATTEINKRLKKSNQVPTYNKLGADINYAMVSTCQVRPLFCF